jgi:hypothetical protein
MGGVDREALYEGLAEDIPRVGNTLFSDSPDFCCFLNKVLFAAPFAWTINSLS